MSVGLSQIAELYSVDGIRLATACAGIRQQHQQQQHQQQQRQHDLVIMELCEGARTAAVFTQNAYCAAPVTVAREHLHSSHLQKAQPKMFIINSGNANAGTGQQGFDDANACCDSLARLAGCNSNEVLPFSTGVIGESLPVEKIQTVLPEMLGALAASSWQQAASAIMTTDTTPKGISKKIEIEGQTITITGISKGSGMIRPDMATMLAYIATDAAVQQDLLQTCLVNAVNRSFNRITVDGDTSTNDACMLVATGCSALPEIVERDDHYDQLSVAIIEVCEWLAQAIIRDGEGATKFITVYVVQGQSEQECLDVAYTIAHSPLVKTAFFASDPNWGRILAAVGRSGINDLDIKTVSIHLNNVCIVRNGEKSGDYTEQAGQEVMDREEITIRVDLGRGQCSEKIWTTDLSHEYIRINAEYRT